MNQYTPLNYVIIYFHDILHKKTRLPLFPTDIKVFNEFSYLHALKIQKKNEERNEISYLNFRAKNQLYTFAMKMEMSFEITCSA